MASPGASALPPAFDGALNRVNNRAGPMSYYTEGTGRPLLLLHSVNAAASAFEMKPLFEGLKTRFRAFAVDLPGFGLSDRSGRTYNVRLYVDAVLDMLDEIDPVAPKEPVDVVALSLSSEFAARAATEMPDRFRSLTLITPTGFSRGSDKLRRAGATREIPGLAGFLQVPLWRRSLFGLLVRKNTIRYFLRRTYGSDAVDEEMVDYDYLAAHQPGAENAPYAFLSGRLFSKDIRTIYEALELPVWVAHGTRGDFGDFTELGWTSDRPNWSTRAFDTGALVHFEQIDAFMAGFQQFLESVDAHGAVDHE